MTMKVMKALSVIYGKNYRWLTEWLIDCLNDWSFGSLIGWLIDGLFDWLVWLIDWFIHWLTYGLIDWYSGLLLDIMFNCTTNRFCDWLPLIDWLTHWFNDWWFDWLNDLLIDWLISIDWWLVVIDGWMIDWLIDWLPWMDDWLIDFHWLMNDWSINPIKVLNIILINWLYNSRLYCCRHCYTSDSRSWHHGGHNKVILCTDCRIFFKKYGKLPPIEDERKPPAYMFKAEFKDLAEDEGCWNNGKLLRSRRNMPVVSTTLRSGRNKMSSPVESGNVCEMKSTCTPLFFSLLLGSKGGCGFLIVLPSIIKVS